MNDKKVAFITCVNDIDEYEEAKYYIDKLNLPEEFEKDVICVDEAPSMTAGYNAAMKSSDAKYKVYLHQDVMIINPNFICDMVNIFKENPQIGLMGVIGKKELADDARAIVEWDYGEIRHTFTDKDMKKKQPDNGQYEYVEAVDGLMLMTQYDVDWREDIFDGWDFYDISQCFEMQRKGFKVAIPWQEKAWAYHDCTYAKLGNYDKYRKKFINEYGDLKNFEFIPMSKEVLEYDAMRAESVKSVSKVIDEGMREELCIFFSEKENRGFLHFREYEVIADIVTLEKANGMNRFWESGETSETLILKQRRLRHLLQRFEHGYGDEKLREYVGENFSIYAINIIYDRYIYDKEECKREFMGTGEKR